MAAIWCSFSTLIRARISPSFPIVSGNILGLSAQGQAVHEVQGINGAVGVIYATLSMTLGNLTFPVEVAWAQLEHVPLLLGRKDIFDRFEIIFRQRDGVVEFREPGTET